MNSDELMETLIAIGSALVNRLGNLAEDELSGSVDPNNDNPNDIRSQGAMNGKSYREEYCSASRPSPDAIVFVKMNNPITFTDFPIDYGGGSWSSYCDQFRGNGDNAYPYQRCILACFKSSEVIPKNIAMPSKPTPLPTEPSEGTCNVVDGGINHTDVVASVINELKATGKTFSTSCDQFEITKRVAWQLGDEEAGLQRKTSGNNCQGYSVDIIAYPDGTTYDVVTGDFGPWWNASCLIDPASQYASAFDPGPIGGNPQLTADITCNNTQGPCAINANQSVSIEWSSTNTNTEISQPCNVDGTPVGPSGASGDLLTASRTYTLTCYNSAGQPASDTVTVNVN